MEYKERTAVLNALAAAILPQLTGVWTFTPEDDSYSVHIDRGDGAKLYLQLASSVGYDKHDRVLIRGSLNIGKDGQYVTVYEGCRRLSAGEISVARERGAEAIAKEITRRLLPEYNRVFALAQAKAKECSEYDAAVKANLNHLACIAGVTLPPQYFSGSDVRTSTSFSAGEVYGAITANSTSAELTLRSLTMAQAAHILQYLAKG